MKTLFAIALCALFWLPGAAFAAGSGAPVNEVVRAEVLKIEDERTELVPGTDTTHVVQSLFIRIEDGERAGEEIAFENDAVPLEAGDVFYLHRQVTQQGDELLLFKDFDRRGELFWLAALFLVLMVAFAGWQGVRSLLMLGVSGAAILFVLVPLLLAGYNPVLVSFGVSLIILALVFFGTHGFRASVTIAFLGTVAAVVVTCLLSLFWVKVMRLSGFGSDAAVYLNFNTDGALDFSGLLLGAILIGILGVLDDVSITQASVVEELKHANASLRFRELYKRAINVGRDHVSSLVNTLALAYVGVSLPLVLFFSTSEDGFLQIINQEIVAAELVRIMLGSIGVVLAVPFTTLLAAWWLDKRELKEKPHPVGCPCPKHRHVHTKE